MPTYEYICQSCNEEFEIFQTMKADRLKECPKCSEPSLRRLIGIGAGIIFKGSGFYETDYKRAKNGEGGESGEGGEGGESGEGGEGGESGEGGEGKGEGKKETAASDSTKASSESSGSDSSKAKSENAK